MYVNLLTYVLAMLHVVYLSEVAFHFSHQKTWIIVLVQIKLDFISSV